MKTARRGLPQLGQSFSGGGDGGNSTPSGAYVRASGDLNVRSRPSLNGSVLGSMSAGEMSEYLGESETDDRGVAWYKIAFRGGAGWVSSRYGDLID